MRIRYRTWLILVAAVMFAARPALSQEGGGLPYITQTPGVSIEAGVPTPLSNLFTYNSGSDFMGSLFLVNFGNYTLSGGNLDISGMDGAIGNLSGNLPDWQNIDITVPSKNQSVYISGFINPEGNNYFYYGPQKFASQFSVSSPASYLYVNITPTDSMYGMDTAMTATATVAATPPTAGSQLVPLISLPSGTVTFQQAAADLGYASIKWAQQISIPSPSPFFSCDNPDCTKYTNVVGTTHDTPQNGWSYCNVHSSVYNPNAGGDCSNSYPYYPYQSQSDDGSALEFGDVPSDPCLFGGTGKGCEGMTAPVGTSLMFTTELMGVPFDDSEQPIDLFNFTWIDTFNGTVGEIATTANLGPVDPGSGTGGITLETVDGVPVSVPEPSTLMLLSVSFLSFSLMYRRQSV